MRQLPHQILVTEVTELRAALYLLNACVYMLLIQLIVHSKTGVNLGEGGGGALPSPRLAIAP